jgi:hypothetical protein
MVSRHSLQIITVIDCILMNAWFPQLQVAQGISELGGVAPTQDPT